MKTEFFVRLKPPTAGIRILSIDGGGVRGIIPLESLSLLQQLLGPDCPIQELVDLGFGTSAGGLVILSLFLQNATVEKSSTVFRTFTRRLFGQSTGQDTNMASGLMRILKTCVHDSMYSSEDLQDALIQQFGRRTRMFDYNPCLPSGTKVAVIACSSKDSSARIFANYNGEGPRKLDSGKLIFHI